ncbi:hypothetical protein FB460_0211 [Propioniferax innocua]|uniref:Uncharacterized protein n=1 Tax=Propioniferax innocua TaxID=1753 RepID=A0A542ZQ88_9ACTN|nr:hypothetical protein FB460_0211 [Propioniferax innocua]
MRWDRQHTLVEPMPPLARLHPALRGNVSTEIFLHNLLR